MKRTAKTGDMELLNLTAEQRDGSPYNNSIVVKVPSIVRAIVPDGNKSYVYIHEYIDNDEVTPFVTEFYVSESTADIAAQAGSIIELSVEEYSNTDVSVSPVTRAIPLHLMREVLKEEQGSGRTKVTIAEDRDQEITYTVSESIPTVWNKIGDNAPLTASNLTSPNIPYFNGSDLADSNIEYDGTDSTVTSGSFNINDGSAADPSLAFSSDKDTGAFLPGLDIFGIAANGSEAFRVDANGVSLDGGSTTISASEINILDGMDGTTGDQSYFVTSGNTYAVGNLTEWDGSGNIVDSGASAPSGSIVGTTDTQTLSSKTIDAATFSTSMTLNDGVNIALGTTSGTQIGTSNSQLIGAFGATPIAQPSSTGTTTGFTQGSGTSVNDDSTFTGNVGTKAYTIGDLVAHLKNLGWIGS